MTEPNVERFEAMYSTHVRHVLAYCQRRTGLADAHDATADVFVVAWRRVSDLPDEPEILPWLYVVAANVLRNQHRTARRALSLAQKMGSQPKPTQPGSETRAIRLAEYEAVNRAIDSLKPKYREVIRLVAWEELPRDQVADMLNVSRAAIDQRLHRAYQQLERRLKPSSTRFQTTEGGESGRTKAF